MAGPGDGALRRTRWVWVASVVAFGLMGAGWALGLPINGTYDESQHLVRAYGAASGQLYAEPEDAVRGGGAWFDVPRSLLPGNVDCAWKTDAAASCQQPAGDDHDRVRVGSAAGRYNPVYYAIVGLPLLVAPNLGGVVAARLLSALGAALLLGAALVIAVRGGRRLLVAGLVVVATPMAMNLDGAINPNGWEIAAGVLLWTGLLTLLRAHPGELSPRFTRWLVVATGVAAGLLLVLRTLGPLLLALIVVACLLLARRGAVGELLRRRDARWAIGVCAVVAAYAVAWTLFSGVTDSDGATGNDATDIPLSNAGRFLLFTRLTFWVNQLVGQFSYGETTLPNWSIVAWYVLVGALVGPALALIRRRQVLVLLGVVVVSVGSLTLLELVYLRSLGWSQHGRYIMPFAVGLVLGALALRRVERTLGGQAVHRLAVGTALVAGFLHLFALLVVQGRFQFGLGHGFSPLAPGWRPPAGPLLPLVTELVGVAVLLGLAWRVTRPAVVTPEAAVPAGTAPSTSEVVPSETDAVASETEETEAEAVVGAPEARKPGEAVRP